MGGANGPLFSQISLFSCSCFLNYKPSLIFHNLIRMELASIAIRSSTKVFPVTELLCGHQQMACGGADIPSASERMPIPQGTMTRSGQADAPRGNKRPPKARVMQYFRMRSDGLYICLLCEAINPRTKQRTYKRSKDSSTNTFWRHLQ